MNGGRLLQQYSQLERIARLRIKSNFFQIEVLTPAGTLKGVQRSESVIEHILYTINIFSLRFRRKVMFRNVGF